MVQCSPFLGKKPFPREYMIISLLVEASYYTLQSYHFYLPTISSLPTSPTSTAPPLHQKHSLHQRFLLHPVLPIQLPLSQERRNVLYEDHHIQVWLLRHL